MYVCMYVFCGNACDAYGAITCVASVSGERKAIFRFLAARATGERKEREVLLLFLRSPLARTETGK